MTPAEIATARRKLVDERLATIDSDCVRLHRDISTSGNPAGLYTRMNQAQLDTLRVERRRILDARHTERTAR